MLVSLLSSTVLFLSTTWAAPSDRTIAFQGNLSPNSVQGNFKLVKGLLNFDPENLDAFNVQMEPCGSSSTQSDNGSWSPSGKLVSNATSLCLTVHDDDSFVGVDCNDESKQGSLTWTLSSGFLFWQGNTTDACPSGLYGYKADKAGVPADTPTTAACAESENVYPFTVLI